MTCRSEGSHCSVVQKVVIALSFSPTENDLQFKPRENNLLFSSVPNDMYAFNNL
jgi:hypothetical protein